MSIGVGIFIYSANSAVTFLINSVSIWPLHWLKNQHLYYLNY